MWQGEGRIPRDIELDEETVRPRLLIEQIVTVETPGSNN